MASQTAAPEVPYTFREFDWFYAISDAYSQVRCLGDDSDGLAAILVDPVAFCNTASFCVLCVYDRYLIGGVGGEFIRD